MVSSPIIAALLVLLASSGQMKAAVIQDPNPRLGAENENFNLHITEKQASFNERIEIDEANDIEYFSVPAHNDVLAADFLYDFRMNITLTRFQDGGVCYLSPLPTDLPNPNAMKSAVRQMASLSANHDITTVSHRWVIVGKVDKTTLREEVRDFCAQYPVYRLMEYTPDSVTVVGNQLEKRVKRQTTIEFDEYDLCGRTPPSGCAWTDWKLRCKFTTHHCVYYLKCKQNSVQKVNICEVTANHESGRIMCCEARCP